MISAAVQEEVLQRMEAIEARHAVRILFAVESGSRAWGFASPDSDYDVRFVYVRPLNWYLSLDMDTRRDVIEQPIVDDIDLSGWDLRKALRLLGKSNPSIVEWLHAPYLYRNNKNAQARLREVLPQIYQPHEGIYHYRSMAQSNFGSPATAAPLSLKKYLYTLRALLSVRWLETQQRPAPLEFAQLLYLLDDALLADVQHLLTLKSGQAEKSSGQAYPRLDAYIQTELQRLKDYRPARILPTDPMATLNPLFVQIMNDFRSC